MYVEMSSIFGLVTGSFCDPGQTLQARSWQQDQRSPPAIPMFPLQKSGKNRWVTAQFCSSTLPESRVFLTMSFCHFGNVQLIIMTVYKYTHHFIPKSEGIPNICNLCSLINHLAIQLYRWGRLQNPGTSEFCFKCPALLLLYYNPMLMDTSPLSFREYILGP